MCACLWRLDPQVLHNSVASSSLLYYELGCAHAHYNSVFTTILLLLFTRLRAGFSTNPFHHLIAMTSFFFGFGSFLIPLNGFTSFNQPGIGVEGGNVAI